MSVLIYQGRRPEVQVRVSQKEVIKYLMQGWNITKHSAIKEVK